MFITNLFTDWCAIEPIFNSSNFLVQSLPSTSWGVSNNNNACIPKRGSLYATNFLSGIVLNSIGAACSINFLRKSSLQLVKTTMIRFGFVAVQLVAAIKTWYLTPNLIVSNDSSFWNYHLKTGAADSFSSLLFWLKFRTNLHTFNSCWRNLLQSHGIHWETTCVRFNYCQQLKPATLHGGLGLLQTVFAWLNGLP